MRILVVDEDPVVRASLELMLVHLGHRADAVATVAEALIKVATTEFDLVLADVRTRGIADAPLAGAMARHKPVVPVVFMTADLSATGGPVASGVLMKPFSLDELQVAIEHVASIV